MIIKEFNLENTKIAIDNTYLAKTEEEKENIYQQFNKIACKILCEGKWEKMSKRQKIYCKVGQVVCEGLGILALNAVFIGMFALWLLEY